MTSCTRCNGSGTEPELPSAAAIRSYMAATGWVTRGPGAAGSLWDHAGRGRQIGTFHDAEPGSFEWQAVIDRLARAERSTPGAVVARIAEHARKAARP